MKHRQQRGMTLIELLVAMGVTSAILVGLTGVLYNVNGHYQEWADRVNSASTGVSLAAALQSDSHRFAECQATNHVAELDFCLPNTGTNSLSSGLAVRYSVGSTSPYVISRQQLLPVAGRPSLVARSQSSAQPVFTVDCQVSAGTISGHIWVDNLSQGSSGSQNSISVSYHAPLKGCP